MDLYLCHVENEYDYFNNLWLQLETKNKIKKKTRNMKQFVYENNKIHI